MKKSVRHRSRTPPPSGPAIDAPARPTPAPEDARKARRAEGRNTRRGPTDDELRDAAAELLSELRRIGALDYPGVREAWQALHAARFYQLSGESGAYAAEVAALEAEGRFDFEAFAAEKVAAAGAAFDAILGAARPRLRRRRRL